MIDYDKLNSYLDSLIDERTAMKIEANDIKIDILKEKKRPDIVIDTSGRKNVDLEDVAYAVNQINKFILIAEVQINLLEEMKIAISRGVLE